MAGGIDTSDRKPRRLRGTPALQFSNRFAAAVLGFAIITGFLLNKIDLIEAAQRKLGWNVLEVSEAENNRRKLFSFVKQNRGEEILKLLEEKEAMEKDF